jgi:anthraniloyl-CoA monooxygenase
MEWFEVVDRYADTLEPEQFMYSMLTGSQRISHENLKLRDRPGSRLRALVRRALRRRHARRRKAAAADVHALTLRGMTLPTASSCRRWRCIRPPTACPATSTRQHTRRARHGRRGAGLDRNDLRLARCPHHARMPRPLERRAGGRWKRIVDFVHANSAGQDRHPDRPCRPQGFDQAGLGRHRPAAGGRQLAADLGLRRCPIASTSQVPRR